MSKVNCGHSLTDSGLWSTANLDPSCSTSVIKFIIFYNKAELQKLAPGIIRITLNPVMTFDLHLAQIFLKGRKRKRWWPECYLLFFSQQKNYTRPNFLAPANTFSSFYSSLQILNITLKSQNLIFKKQTL